jgi:hypothetical protein
VSGAAVLTVTARDVLVTTHSPLADTGPGSSAPDPIAASDIENRSSAAERAPELDDRSADAPSRPLLLTSKYSAIRAEQ